MPPQPSETTRARRDPSTATNHTASQDTGQQALGLDTGTVAQVQGLEDSIKEMTLTSPIPPSTRRHFFNLGAFKRILSRPPKNPPAVAGPSLPAPPTPECAELPPLSSVTARTGINPRQSHGRHAVRPGLQTFRIDRRFDINVDPRSVIDDIRVASSTITTLSLRGQALDNVGWKDILQQIDLPGLRIFNISSDLFVKKDGAALDDLIDFFRRHCAITHLTMHGMHLEDRILTHIPSPPVLPALEELSAHSWHATMIVKSHVLGTRDTSWESPLRSISLMREQYSVDHKRYRYQNAYATTCKEFEHAFDAISLLPVDVSHSLTLGLGFPPTNQTHEEWMTDHIERGSNSPICQMNGVRRLVLKCGHFACFTHIGFNEILPAFVNLFPDLRELEAGPFSSFGGIAPPEDLQNRLKEKCPQLHKITADRSGYRAVALVGPKAPIPPVQVVDESWDTSQQAL